MSDKPRWVQALPETKASDTDLIRRRAYESLLSVDEQIGSLLDLLDTLGVERDTFIFFTSDNGVGWGEHRLTHQRKGCPYEECQRVPMLAWDGRRTAAAPGVRRTPVLNIDLAPRTISFRITTRMPVDTASSPKRSSAT